MAKKALEKMINDPSQNATLAQFNKVMDTVDQYLTNKELVATVSLEEANSMSPLLMIFDQLPLSFKEYFLTLREFIRTGQTEDHQKMRATACKKRIAKEIISQMNVEEESESKRETEEVADMKTIVPKFGSMAFRY